MKIIRRPVHEPKHPAPPGHIDRFFDEPLWDPFGFWDKPLWEPFGLWKKPLMPAKAGFVPRMDISEDDKQLKIVANIPGYDPKDIEIEVREGALVIKGKTEEEKEEKDKHYFCRERASGEFYRQIALPTNVDPDKAECSAKNGILTITIPKTGAKEKKTLKIKID